jgi:hypothetical protein
MNIITLVVGKPYSKRISYVEKVTENIKTQWMKGIELKKTHSFTFSSIDQDTEVIVFDNVEVKNFNPDIILSLSSGIMVNKQGKEGFPLRPKFILIFDDTTFDGNSFMEGESFKRRINLINVESES